MTPTQLKIAIVILLVLIAICWAVIIYCFRADKRRREKERREAIKPDYEVWDKFDDVWW